MRRTLFFISLLVALTGLVAFARYVLIPQYADRFLTPSPTPTTATTVPAPTPTWSGKLGSDAEAKLQLVFDHLTPRAKIGQLIAYPLTLGGKDVFAVSASPSASSAAVFRKTKTPVEVLGELQPGFVTYFGQRISLTTAQATSDVLMSGNYPRLTPEASAAAALYIPPLIAVDHEGGSVQRLNGTGFTVLPSWQKQCDDEVIARAEKMNRSAREVSAAGVHFIFGPVIDVASRSGALRERVCGDNQNDVHDNAAMWTRIFQKFGVTSVLKHYPGIGQTTVDLHRDTSKIPIDPAQRDIYFDLLKNLSLGVMTAHVGVISQGETESDGLPCSLSPTCLLPITSLRPAPLIFTDALEMESAQLMAQENAASEAATLAEIAERALLAGNDVLVFGPTVKNDQFNEIVEVLEKKAVSSPQLRERIDQSVRKILEKKYLLLQ